MRAATFSNRIRWLLAGVLLLPSSLLARPVAEYDLKAAFVYNFVLFTNWPAETSFEGGTLNICVSSHSPMRSALTAMQDRPVRGRRLALRQPMLETARACHVLILEPGDRHRWPQWRNALVGAPVLTIADEHELGLGGSILTLWLEGTRIVFGVNTRAAGIARIEVSSKLLRLAHSVQ